MPSVKVSGPGPMPEPGSLIPGSFKGTISMGTRYVPAPTSGQATWNELLRAYAPWGPIGVDPSPTGFAGGLPGRFGKALPYVGGSIGAFLAGEAAGQKQGQMVRVPPRNRPMEVLDTVRNLLRLAPSNLATNMLGVGLGVTKGLTGLFQDHPDRTGVAAGMRDQPGGPSFAPGGSYYDLPQWSQQGPTPTYQPIQSAVVPSYGDDESLAFGGDMIPTSTNFGSTWDPADYWAGQGPQS